ncbi:MAG: hypothetical protein AABX86_01090, partial [Nanoarchaeota archaeon]
MTKSDQAVQIQASTPSQGRLLWMIVGVLAVIAIVGNADITGEYSRKGPINTQPGVYDYTFDVQSRETPIYRWPGQQDFAFYPDAGEYEGSDIQVASRPCVEKITLNGLRENIDDLSGEHTIILAQGDVSLYSRIFSPSRWSQFQLPGRIYDLERKLRSLEESENTFQVF